MRPFRWGSGRAHDSHVMRRLTVAIPEEAAARLDRLAQREYRDRKQQAALLLVDAIARAELTDAVPRGPVTTTEREPAR